MTERNIDRMCAKIGFDIVDEGLKKSDQENIIQKALGILSEDGTFAYLIWLESKNALRPDNTKPDELCAKNVLDRSCELLKNVGLISEGVNSSNLKNTLIADGGILDDIHQTFFVKQLLERMLIYGLFKAKSLLKSHSE